MERIVCIDFETANSFKGSICSVGLAIIEDSCIVDKKYWLVKPHPEHFYFDSFNTMIHGIDKRSVEFVPEFNFVYPQIKKIFDNSVIVAHNAEFDISVLCQTLELYGIEYPEIDYICTYKIALKTWSELDNFKLNTICKFLNYEFQHHNAQEDAVVCGKVILAALAKKSILSVMELASILGVYPGKLYKDRRIPCSINEF